MGQALGRYAELQRLVAPRAGELVPLGATDMRPALLPERFEQALGLVTEPADRERLEALRPDVARWCEELAAAPGGASIDHNDLHPDNVFVGPPPRAYDWGDSVVAHPFASMLVHAGLHARARAEDHARTTPASCACATRTWPASPTWPPTTSWCARWTWLGAWR